MKAWIAAGRFRLDEKVVTQANLRLPDPGERLSFGEVDSATASWSHRKRIGPKLTVLHLDAALAIVDKSAGLLSVRAPGHREPAALDLLGQYLNDAKADGLRRRLFGEKGAVNPLPVHRLDQYTSGLLCFAMNPEARASLIDQVRSHELVRVYLAFLDGEMEKPSGVWSDFLKLDPEGYNQRIADPHDPDATEAITHYEVLEVFARHHISKVRLHLETGLKHQIRLQAAQRGTALLGDRLYHPGTRQVLRKGGKAPFGCQRQALHASALGLRHPADGRSLSFESRLPADLGRLEERLRLSNQPSR